MTPQEALELLNNMEFAEQYQGKQEYTDMLLLCKKALEKQIPQKPLDICTPVVTWGLCPICKGELNKLGNQPHRVFKGTKYCPDCGQALDWSDN